MTDTDGAMYSQGMSSLTALGREIKRRREARGLTQPALAKRAGIAVSYLAKLEGGARLSPSFPTVARLARALGCRAEMLLEADWSSDVPTRRKQRTPQKENTTMQQFFDRIDTLLANPRPDPTALASADLALQQLARFIESRRQALELAYLHAHERQG